MKVKKNRCFSVVTETWILGENIWKLRVFIKYFSCFELYELSYLYEDKYLGISIKCERIYLYRSHFC
jgi:hypothetical protein